VNLFLAIVITVGAVALSVAAMLWARRRAPEGSYFADGDRAAGVFGVLSTGFAILVGFVVFLAFTSFDTTRSGAEVEALTVAQQLETAQLFESSAATELTGELVCYAHSVAGVEWDQLETGTLREGPNEWGVRLYETMRTIDPESPSEQAAFGKWLDQTTDRETARQDRIHGAVGVIPSPLWIVLFLVSAIMFAYMLFFADSGERAVVQALMMGSVTAVMVTLLLLLTFLDHPYRPGPGSLRPVAMERVMLLIDRELALTDQRPDLPCDDQGRPTDD
jgi:hypothetical protein